MISLCISMYHSLPCMSRGIILALEFGFFSSRRHASLCCILAPQDSNQPREVDFFCEVASFFDVQNHLQEVPKTQYRMIAMHLGNSTGQLFPLRFWLLIHLRRGCPAPLSPANLPKNDVGDASTTWRTSCWSRGAVGSWLVVAEYCVIASNQFFFLDIRCHTCYVLLSQGIALTDRMWCVVEILDSSHGSHGSLLYVLDEYAEWSPFCVGVIVMILSLILSRIPGPTKIIKIQCFITIQDHDHHHHCD